VTAINNKSNLIMAFSNLEISRLEHFYGVTFSEQYKAILLLIGDKITDISLKDIRNKKHTGGVYNSSIYEIQDYMKSWITECEISELYEPCIFFITAFLRYNDYENVAYFIKSKEAKDYSVYSFRSNNILDVDSIDKFSDNIEQWLYRVNPILYVELQAKKIFYNMS
jgi:hypothetical protein